MKNLSVVCVDVGRFEGRLTKGKKYKIVKYVAGKHRIPQIINDQGKPFFLSNSVKELFDGPK